MKKNLLVLALIAFVGSAHAYKLTIINESDYDMKGEAWFGGPGICGKKEFPIAARKTYVRDVEGCCLTWMKITTTEFKGQGDNSIGKSTNVEGRNTGFGLSCRNNNFRVTVSSTGAVTAELI